MRLKAGMPDRRGITGCQWLAAGAFALGLAAKSAVVPVAAQDKAAGEIAAAEELNKANRKKLSESERKALSLQSDVAAIDQEQARLNQELQATARRVQTFESQMTEIEGRLGELEQQKKMVEGSLAQRQDQIAKLLGAMQRMGRNPPPVIITQREDALAMVRSAMLLAKAFPELKEKADALSGDLRDFDRIIGERKTNRDRLEAETNKLKDAQTRLASLMETKRQSMSERQSELEEVRKSITEITQSVSEVSELISRLEKAVGEKTGLGAYERETAVAAQRPAGPPQPAGRAEQASPAPAPPASGPAAAPSAPANQQVATATPPRPPKAIELAPRSTAFSGNPMRMKPAIPFEQARGMLPPPAHGKRILSFGEKPQSGTPSKGIVIETRHGGQITSPCDGWVVYAGEFRAYGQLLIISAGGGYHILLTGLSQIDVQLGQFVLAGEPVGTMRAQPKGSLQDNSPVLYVEFRKDGRPIDPDPWWVEGSQKVQG